MCGGLLSGLNETLEGVDLRLESRDGTLNGECAAGECQTRWGNAAFVLEFLR